MSELQIGLLAIGTLVVAGVFAYNQVQERRARHAAERAFRSGHADVLLEGVPAAPPAAQQAQHLAPRAPAPEEAVQPDERIDYVVSLALEKPAAHAIIDEHWKPIERRHAPRALLAASGDGKALRAGLQLVTRDGAVGEADLIEFRSSVETLAAAIGASVQAPEMRTAVDAARALDAFCAEADIEVVVHVIGGPFPGTKIRAAVEANGLAMEPEGRFALRDDRQRLLYTLGAKDGAPFAAATMREATPQGLSLALEVARAPDTRRSFESMARLAAQLASLLGGRMVDDNGNALDERAVAAIAQQLETVRAGLEARGIAPGSAAALRVFS